MQFSSQLLENAVNEFAKLPGIGKKTALRLVLHLLKQEENNVQQFSEVIAKMRNEIKFCQRCYNVADGDIVTTLAKFYFIAHFSDHFAELLYIIFLLL